jgi:hypothetical protein
VKAWVWQNGDVLSNKSRMYQNEKPTVTARCPPSSTTKTAAKRWVPQTTSHLKRTISRFSQTAVSPAGSTSEVDLLLDFSILENGPIVHVGWLVGGRGADASFVCGGWAWLGAPGSCCSICMCGAKELVARDVSASGGAQTHHFFTWVCGTNPSTLQGKKAPSHHIGETK